MFKRKSTYLLVGMMIVIICALLSNIFINQTVYDITAFLAIACGTLYIFLDLAKGNRSEAVSVLLAYAVRVMLVVSAIYFGGILNVFIIGPDATGFFRVSQEYFSGNYGEYKTRYPYLLNFFYHIFGPNRIVVQYINVFCWYLCWKIISKMMDNCNMKHKKSITIIFCFMPQTLLMTSELLRESIMMLFIMLSFFYLWKWMENGNLWNVIVSFLLSFPAVLLHSVSVVLWAGILLVYIFWNYQLQKWNFTTGKLFVLLMGIVAIYIFFHYRIYSIFGYFPDELSLEAITSRAYDQGRSNYLNGMHVDGIIQFALWTIIRSIYFWMSPIVFDWNSIKDVVGVIFDVIPLMYLIVITCIKKPCEYVNRQYVAGIIILLLYTVLYAWGTGNAGTAMRHRNMLLGLLVMTYCIRHIRKDKIHDVKKVVG